MPLGNPLTRIRSVEFFGVLLPGLYALASVSLSWIAADKKSWNNLKPALVAHFESEPKWYPAVAVLFAAYLLGSVFKSLPVWKLDTPLGEFFGKFVDQESERMRRLYEGSFPYASMLEYDLAELRKAGCISVNNSVPRFSRCHPHVAFDYCKEYASLRNASAAARIQGFEAQTRMFYGMFWATLLGCGVSLGFGWMYHAALPLVWFIVSVVMAVVFGQRLRFVRGHEARMTYYAYLVQREVELEAAAERAPPPTET